MINPRIKTEPAADKSKCPKEKITEVKTVATQGLFILFRKVCKIYHLKKTSSTKGPNITIVPKATALLKIPLPKSQIKSSCSVKPGNEMP